MLGSNFRSFCLSSQRTRIAVYRILRHSDAKLPRLALNLQSYSVSHSTGVAIIPLHTQFPIIIQPHPSLALSTESALTDRWQTVCYFLPVTAFSFVEQEFCLLCLMCFCYLCIWHQAWASCLLKKALQNNSHSHLPENMRGSRAGVM